MSYSISVIIPSYNSSKTIATTIEKILDLNCKELQEIIVVDSSDDDVTKNIIAKYKNKKVSCITSGIKVMPAAQRNIGAENAKGKILVFIDSDAYPEKDWLKKILENYKKGYKVGGGAYLVPSFQLNNKIVLAQYFLEFSEFLPRGGSRPKNMVPSCNLYCDKEIFYEVKGFPEVRASEDSLFGLKVIESQELIFDPNILVYHIFRENKIHYLQNQKMLGEYIYTYRKEQKKYLRNKYFVYITLPLILIFKFLRISYRVFRLEQKYLKLFFYCILTFLRGFIEWGKGFVKGLNYSS